MYLSYPSFESREWKVEIFGGGVRVGWWEWSEVIVGMNGD
jgi:hypothetical protein